MLRNLLLTGVIAGLYAAVGILPTRALAKQPNQCLSQLQQNSPDQLPTSARISHATRLTQLADQQFSQDNYQAAIRSLQAALAIWQNLNNLGAQADVIHKLGQSYEALGQYQSSLQHYQCAVDVYIILGEKENAAGSLSGSSFIHLRTGHYYQAIEAAQKSLDLFPKGAVAMNNLGMAYGYLGQYEKSLEIHQATLNFRRSQLTKDSGQSPISFAFSLVNIGLVYNLLNRPQEALNAYEEASMLFQQSNHRLGQAISLNGLGETYALMGDHSRAIRIFQSALKIAQSANYPRIEGNILGHLGKSFHQLGQSAQANDFYEKALIIHRNIQNREGEAHIFFRLAELSEEKGNVELAIVFLKQSVDIYEAIRKGMTPLKFDLQQSYTQKVSGTYRHLADLLLSQGRVLEAQQVLERLKIQELHDYTRDTRTGDTRTGDTPNESPLNPLEQPILPAFTNKIALGNALTQCEQTKCPRKSQLSAQVTQANQAFEELIKRLKAALKASEIQDPAQLQSEEFTRNAQDIILANPNVKTLLLYPLVLDDKLWLVWGAQAGKAGIVFDSQPISVTRKELSETVIKFQTLLANRNSDIKELQQVSQQLYQWLIAPLRPHLDETRIQQIVFSLDRVTRYIPIAALYDGKQYLIENFALSTILTTQTNTTDKLSQNPQDNPVLGFGLTQAQAGFSPLPAVKTEIDHIIRQNSPQDAIGIFPGLERLDQDFTETALRDNIADYRILHLATHGSFLTSNPNESFLLLGDGQKLTIPAIERIKNLARTHLVVLSACETGKGGMNRDGLEVAGMGHYFLRSGAKSVMASLWLVNDPATAYLMAQFYRHLATGKSKPEALRQVQREFLSGTVTLDNLQDFRAGGRPLTQNSRPPNLAHPYYWAPFILIGNNL